MIYQTPYYVIALNTIINKLLDDIQGYCQNSNHHIHRYIKH